MVYFAPESISAKRYMIAADKLIAFLDSVDDNISNSAIQPTTAPGVSACSTASSKPKEQPKKSDESCGTGCGCH